jgi:adenosylhomocysteinase
LAAPDQSAECRALIELGAMLTPLSAKQARYISVPAEGPYKPQTYRY